MTSAPPAGKRERSKQANRGAILDAARQVFADMGYGAATVRDIVRRTDLASGTFYNYFPDKEAVFRALLEDAAVRARARVRQARRGARTLEAFVRDGFGAYFAFVVEDPLTFELTSRNAGTIRTRFADDPSLLAGQDELRADLDEAIRRGALPPMDTELMAAAMVGAGLEIAARMVARDPVDVDAAAAFATRLFVAGVRAQ